ncbi:DNA mismatch repair protein MutS [Candidatus Micrarchaeota archaeon]|nr:DNA mismatch repair protein MutS [Candidatus Micrarchaeota archaeon]
MNNVTPAMRQYWSIKKQFPDCILLFRMGDFYETFYDDAKVVSRELNIVLTSRGKGEKKAPLAGIPHHALDIYLHRLLKKGYKVAICEQLEDPKKAKGIVKRGVVRVITPGTILEPDYLESKRNNYLMSVSVSRDKNGVRIGVSACDLSTGELYTTTVSGTDMLETELERFSPSELVIPESMPDSYPEIKRVVDTLAKEINIKITPLEDYKFDPVNGALKIKETLHVEDVRVFDIADKPLSLSSTGALLEYLERTLLKTDLPITKISYYRPDGTMIIDAVTQRNLELVRNLVDGSKRGTLLSVIDETVTPMGGRLLVKWMLNPLRTPDMIKERLDAVEVLHENTLVLEKIRDLLRHVYDTERLATRLMLRIATPKDLLTIKESVKGIKEIQSFLKSSGLPDKHHAFEYPDDTGWLNELYSAIDSAIKDDAPAVFRDGGVIKDGFSSELDELRKIVGSTKEWLAELELAERERTGIKTLRVRYNRIIGYFIEVPKSQASKVPPDYIRKQTQVATERFITPLLKEKEAQALNAEERIKVLEREIYDNLLNRLSNYGDRLRRLSHWIAEIDVYHSFAYVAGLYNYTKPVVDTGYTIEIRKGRHPVVERMVDRFIPNDVKLDEKETVMIITGPNMAGKSCVMRMVALITLLAQIGSFVPAEYARIGVVDRIFTRVGARDDITRGESTFMMEMTETALILNNATDRSLIILDEIGRGTSTYDGMSLAWAIVEYIATRLKSRTMFATHYHLLNLLSLKYDRVVNYHMTVKEYGDDVVFLYRLEPGGTDKSYGIHVARIAGLPKEVILRALEIASELEKNDTVHREALDKFTALESLEDENVESVMKEFELRLETADQSGKSKSKQTSLFMFLDEES